MPNRKLLLGLDIGTSACKAALYTTDGELVALAYSPLGVDRPRPGWVEQAPAAIWLATCDAIGEVLARALARPDEVVSVCAVGHSPTLILLDNRGEPCRPAIVWQDTRAGAEARELAATLGDDLADLLGGRFPVNPSFMPGRLLWLRRNEPSVLARAAKALEPKDYVHWRLTGECVSDSWSAKGLANLRTGEFVGAWRELLGIEAGLVPTIARPFDRIGGVSAAAGAALGLLAGTPVAAGWTDGLSCLLGSGVYTGGDLGFLSTGTSDVLGVVVDGAPRGDARLLEVPLAGDRRIVMGPTQTAGGSLTWLADRFFGGNAAEALTAAAEAKPGARGLIFLPYLEGERAPIWDERARGVLFGLSTDHGLPEIARAVLEGVAASDRQVLETVEESTGVKIKRIRVTGSGGRGLWGQIRASFLGRNLETTSEQPGTLGAAMMAGVAAGVWPDLETVSAAVVRVAHVLAPDDKLVPVYDRVFATYSELYPRLRSLWRAD